MPLSNAERQRQYRERKRQEMGDAAYRAEQANKRKLRRSGVRFNRPAPAPAPEPQEPPEPEPAENNKCDTLFKGLYKQKKWKNPSLSKKQLLKNTWKPFLKLYRDIHGENYDCHDLSWIIDNPQNVINFIKNKYKNLNTQRTKLTLIGAVLEEVKKYSKYAKIYKHEAYLLNQKIEGVTDKNLTTDKEKKNIMKWTDIKILWKDENINLNDRILMGIYTVIPPRRIEMAELLTLTNTSKDLDPNLNYLYIKGNTSQIIMQKYKTHKFYGKTKITISNKLEFVKLLKQYILENHIKPGDRVFKSQSNFSKYLSNTFKQHTGKDISVNILRHSFITDYLSKPRSIEDRKHIAKLLGHNISTLDKYNRIDLK